MDDARTAPQPLSQHRLPAPYRGLLAFFWLLPILLLTAAVGLGTRAAWAVLDVRLLLPLALMALPAWSVWQEGVDVLADGLRVRVGWPRYYAYERLAAWRLTASQGEEWLTIWEATRQPVLNRHARHLTELPVLLQALSDHVPPRAAPPATPPAAY